MYPKKFVTFWLFHTFARFCVLYGYKKYMSTRKCLNCEPFFWLKPKKTMLLLVHQSNKGKQIYMNETKKDEPLYMTGKEVCEKCRMSRITLWRKLQNDETFPKPATFTKALRFNRQAVLDWMLSHDPELAKRSAVTE